jgi:hypothetical protein
MAEWHFIFPLPGQRRNGILQRRKARATANDFTGRGKTPVLQVIQRCFSAGIIAAKDAA